MARESICVASGMYAGGPYLSELFLGNNDNPSVHVLATAFANASPSISHQELYVRRGQCKPATTTATVLTLKYQLSVFRGTQPACSIEAAEIGDSQWAVCSYNETLRGWKVEYLSTPHFYDVQAPRKVPTQLGRCVILIILKSPSPSPSLFQSFQRRLHIFFVKNSDKTHRHHDVNYFFKRDRATQAGAKNSISVPICASDVSEILMCGSDGAWDCLRGGDPGAMPMQAAVLLDFVNTSHRAWQQQNTRAVSFVGWVGQEWSEMIR